MAKRTRSTTPARGTTTKDAPGATVADAMEQRLVAFAEQLGWMAGTIQAKAEGWLDPATLTRQIAGVRDGATHLLEQLARSSTEAAKKASAAAPRRAATGRSGGVVDAPGKKRRKRLPADPGARLAGSQAAKVRTARTMVKTNRHRGRGGRRVRGQGRGGAPALRSYGNVSSSRLIDYFVSISRP